MTSQEVEIAADLVPLGTPLELFAAPEDGDLDDPEIYPLVPGIDTGVSDFRDRFVDYNLRGPRDVVVSGPVVGGWGPGRYFRNRRLARAWCEAKYGAERTKPVDGFTKGRWAFLIKNLANGVSA